MFVDVRLLFFKDVEDGNQHKTENNQGDHTQKFIHLTGAWSFFYTLQYFYACASDTSLLISLQVIF